MRVLAIFFVLTFAAAQVQLDESYKDGTLEVVVVTSFGEPTSRNITISVQQIVNGKPGTIANIGPLTKLKYGLYKLAVRSPAAYPVDRLIDIKKPHQIVVIGLFVAPIELPWSGNSVNGSLPASIRPLGCQWIRIVSPFDANEYAETFLSNGHFTFTNVKPGKYLATVFGDEGICGVGLTTIHDERVQDIELAIH